jgi:predicted GNAT superfamily acetyltransferase
MKEIKIRKASRDDLEHLLELNQSNLPHVGSITHSDMEHLHSQAIYFRVAEFNSQTAGFLIAFAPEADYASLNFLWFKKRYPAFVYIDRIIIAAAARRKGIAYCLYRDLEHFAQKRKIPLMACEYNLRPKNDISRQFHQRYGFNQVGTQETENSKKTVSLQIKPVVPLRSSSPNGVVE